jgi:hypothetical protein
VERVNPQQLLQPHRVQRAETQLAETLLAVMLPLVTVEAAVAVVLQCKFVLPPRPVSMPWL